LPDDHDRCVYCLGHAQAEPATEEPNCPHCNAMSVRTLRRRIALILSEASTSGPPSFPTDAPPEPQRKRQRPHVSVIGMVGSEQMPVQCSPCSPDHSSPVDYPEPRFRPPSSAGDFVSFWAPRRLAASELVEWSEKSSHMDKFDSHISETHEPGQIDQELLRVISKVVEELNLE
ncbi:hypothetical protein ABG768_008251, partial [Culter alburnus]